MSERTRTFHFIDAATVLLDLAAAWPLAPDDRGGFVAEGLRFVPPGVLPPVAERDTPLAWIERLPLTLGVEYLVLLQAGAMALGIYRDDELVDHVARKRYVVRGRGRAQPTHLRTKGKSRYGSRLRLQNHEMLLDEAVQRLHDWTRAEDPARLVHVSASPRLLDDLLGHDPPPPFTRHDLRFRRVPFDVHVPDHAELKRVRRLLTHGRVENS